MEVNHIQMTIYDTVNFVTNNLYIHNTIYEFDIQKANITMLLNAGKISQDEFDYLCRLPKKAREENIGLKILSDKSIYRIISEGIREAKKDLVENTGLEWKDVVRIANDALFITKDISNSTAHLADSCYQSDNNRVKFILKNQYTSMIKLGPLVIFYNSHISDIRVIGIKDNELEYHDGFMLSFIVSMIESLERAPINQCIDQFTSFYNQYLKMELPLEFYREFNASSMYNLYTQRGESFMMTSYSGELRYLNIGYNAFILRELYYVLITKYRFI